MFEINTKDKYQEKRVVMVVENSKLLSSKDFCLFENISNEYYQLNS